MVVMVHKGRWRQRNVFCSCRWCLVAQQVKLQHRT